MPSRDPTAEASMRIPSAALFASALAFAAACAAPCCASAAELEGADAALALADAALGDPGIAETLKAPEPGWAQKAQKAWPAAAAAAGGFVLLKANIFPASWQNHPTDRIGHFLAGSAAGFFLDRAGAPAEGQFAAAMAMGPAKEAADMHYDPVDASASMFGVAAGRSASRLAKYAFGSGQAGGPLPSFDNECERFASPPNPDAGAVAQAAAVYALLSRSEQAPGAAPGALGYSAGALAPLAGLYLAESAIAKLPPEKRGVYGPAFKGALSGLAMAQAGSMLFGLGHPAAWALGAAWGAANAAGERKEHLRLSQKCLAAPGPGQDPALSETF